MSDDKFAVLSQCLARLHSVRVNAVNGQHRWVRRFSGPQNVNATTPNSAADQQSHGDMKTGKCQFLAINGRVDDTAQRGGTRW